MINGNASEFIDKMHYEDHYVVFNSEKYFVNGCQTKMIEKNSEFHRR